jgi:hypothetical protein
MQTYEITNANLERWIAIDEVIETCGMPSQADHDFYIAFAETLAIANHPAYLKAYPEST